MFLATRSIPFLALAAVAAPLASADVVTLRQGLDGYTGTADTTLFSGQPDINSSTSASVIISSAASTSGLRQGLLRFDVSSIPSTSTINSAILTLSRGPNGGFAGGSGATALYDLTIDLDFSSVTYATAGATGGGIDLATETTNVAYPFATGLGSGGSTTIDLTGAVAADVLNAAGNFGFVINTTNSSFLDIASSESGTAGLRPSLVIDFTPVPEPASLALLGLGGAALLGRRRN